MSTLDFCLAWVTSRRSKYSRRTSFIRGVMCLIRPPATTTTPGSACEAISAATSAVRERKELSYKKWAKRLTKYYSLIEKYFSPSLIVIGGGVSRKSDNFVPFIDIDTPIVPAKLRNEAGIIGAAYYASTK